jgi:hypothetical protein
MIDIVKVIRENRKKSIGFLILFTFTCLVLITSLFSLRVGTNTLQNNALIELSGVKEYNDLLWVNNPTFETPIEPTWFSTSLGDPSDILASTSLNQANFEIIGDADEQQVLLNSATFSNWEAFNKTELAIVPQRASVPYYGVTADGAWCSHWWNENEVGGQPKNTPRMHWKTNVSLPVDMSDYIITSVNFDAVINASVDSNIDTPGDTLARPGVNINQFQIYDYAQFYVEVSTLDIDDLNTYRIAFNQTVLLGNEALSIHDIEGYIGVFEEQAIIDALTNVLLADPGHDNFTVILGIYMYCEDNNSGTDWDYWDDMRFKTLNLTFNYVKKIDQFTTISWNQELDDISGTNVQITDANLKFKFKINQNWTYASQNSQIRIFINDRKFEQTISLIDYIYSPVFQEAKAEGYDISSKILPYEEFNLTIQVFLAENFGLENNITISITDVFLYISYTETFPDVIPEPLLFTGLFIIALSAAIFTGGYFLAYHFYLKYPVPVRKVRKYRKTLSKDNTPDVNIMNRERSFNKIYQQEISKSSKYLKGTPIDGKILREKMLKK